MLLWKSWRDLRIALFVALGWFALQLGSALLVLVKGAGKLQVMLAGADQSIQFVGLFIGVQTVVITLIAFAIGTVGIGRDIGVGSGSFLLTRPVPRGRFVWTEWFSGFVALAAMLSLAAVTLWIIVRCGAFRILYVNTVNGVTTPHALTLGSLPVRAAAVDALCALLFVALVFGLTYLGTVAFHHSTAGLLFSLSFFVAWLVVTGILRFKFPGMASHIPDLLLRPFGSNLEHMQLIPHLTASILARLAILPLFPLLAHFFLRRTEV
jgi:hypothetical protein